MSTKIDQAIAAAGPTAPVRPVVRSREPSTPAAGMAPHHGGDSVKLTGDAQVMQQLEQRVQTETGVDEAKVAEMRRILAQGQYSADPQAIATRLMQLESSLGGGQ